MDLAKDPMTKIAESNYRRQTVDEVTKDVANTANSGKRGNNITVALAVRRKRSVDLVTRRVSEGPGCIPRLRVGL